MRFTVMTIDAGVHIASRPTDFGLSDDRQDDCLAGCRQSPGQGSVTWSVTQDGLRAGCPADANLVNFGDFRNPNPFRTLFFPIFGF